MSVGSQHTAHRSRAKGMGHGHFAARAAVCQGRRAFCGRCRSVSRNGLVQTRAAQQLSALLTQRALAHYMQEVSSGPRRRKTECPWPLPECQPGRSLSGDVLPCAMHHPTIAVRL